MVTTKTLQQLLQDTEQQLEATKATLYRCDGAVALLKYLLAQPTSESVDAPAAAE